MAAGRRKPFNQNNKRNRPNSRRRLSVKSNHQSRSSSDRSRLFVDGGVLSDWPSDISSPTPFGGRKRNASKSKSTPKFKNSDRTKAVRSKSDSQKSSGKVFSNQHSSINLQEGLNAGSFIVNNNGDNDLDESHPIVLVDSKETQIVGYIDQTPVSKPQNVECTYEYGSSFVLGDSFQRGSELYDESEATPCGIGSSSIYVDEQGGSFFNLSSFEKGKDVHQNFNYEVGTEMEEEMVDETPQKRNSGFVTIGGMNIYTEDISDAENDGESVVGSLDEENSDSSEGKETSSENDISEDASFSDLDIDQDVAEDYLEGIGGSNYIIDVKWLVEQDLDESHDDTSSSSCVEKNLEKFGGAIPGASREYGRKRTLSRMKYSVAAKNVWSTAKQKSDSRFPQSWPLGAQKSERKKHRKEMITVKHRERMLRRGIDLELINLKLEQIVLDGVPMFSFKPMHSRDCSQVCRLASVYRLQSGCEGSGRKRSVTVIRTEQTSMPSARDKLFLERLIRAGKEDSDLAVQSGKKNRSTKSVKGSGLSPQENQQSARSKSSEKRRSGKTGSYANQPLSFVTSSIMGSETAKITTINSKESNDAPDHNGVGGPAEFGAFELHTTGFGSKMMAKMGFKEGRGLGKDGQGMAKPIEVIRRPKSLGLGVAFSHTDGKSSSDMVKNNSQVRDSTTTSNSQKFGAFEMHTKGFGSKMMGKMGFVQGGGLGKDSQGIVNPLVAVRLPKSRGLGAKG